MERAVRRRIIFWLPFGLGLAVILVWLLGPRPVPVDFATVDRGLLQVSASDEGETRVKEIYVVSAPVTGLMRRIDLEPGDPVVAAETVVARIEPTDPVVLDVRSEAEARAAVQAASASLELARAEVERAEAELEFARSELERFRGLAERDTISESALDDAERRERTATAALAESRAQLSVREFELERAEARLLPASAARERRSGCDCIDVHSPVNGRVLRRLQQSEAVVTPGTPLMEIGDPREMEIVVDMLSTEAVLVRPGQAVLIEAWGGAEPLNGRVQRVEPFGFTKVSALGIEEQRVNVIVDFTDPPDDWTELGHGYRVEPRIILWEGDDVLKVPVSALFRSGESWSVFVDDDGRAIRRELELGRWNSMEAEVVAGLVTGDRVVLHPGDRVRDGVSLVDRSL